MSTILRKKGANILTYPSAFAYSTGKAHWEILLRARAIETQTFIIAAAQIGYHNEKRRSFGRAMIVDPWGKIIAECGDDENVVDHRTVTINYAELHKVRSNMPCFEHRRDDVYALTPIQLNACSSSSLDDCDQTKPFYFEKHPIQKATIFYESTFSVAFTNICCVVPGRELAYHIL